MKKRTFIWLWALLAGACLLAPDTLALEEPKPLGEPKEVVAEQDTIVEEIEEEEPWNQFQLNEDISLSFNGYMYLYHIRNHNSYHLDTNAAWTEISAGFGIDLKIREEFSTQLRLVGTGLYGRPENYLYVEPADMEGFVDLANVTWHTEVFDKKLNITAGLQELLYGDGFLIMDGYSEERAIWTTPIRSMPAIKGSLELGQGDTLDLFAAHIRNDFVSYEALLGLGTGLTTGGSLVGTDLHLAETVSGTWDFGAFYKSEDNSTEDLTIPGNPPIYIPDPPGPGSDTLALSIRDEITFGENDDLLLAAEVVRQYGQTRVVNDVIVPDDHDRRAWGGQVTARYQLSNEGLKPYIQGRFVYFGGDKRSSKSVEGFDPFFFGWADWGQWWIGDMTSFAVPHNNARIFNFELGLELTDVSMLRLYYFNTSLLEELDNGSLAAAQPMYTKAWSHEVNVVYDYSFNDYVFAGVMGGINFPRNAAENFFGNDKDNYELITWVGFAF